MSSCTCYTYSWKLCCNFGPLASPPVLHILLHLKVCSLTISLPDCLNLSWLYFYWLSFCSVIYSTKQLGPVLKIVICICLPVVLLVWPLIAIVSSILGGAAYGFLAPILATSQAVEHGKTDKLFHCIYVCFWNMLAAYAFQLIYIIFAFSSFKDLSSIVFIGWNLGYSQTELYYC